MRITFSILWFDDSDKYFDSLDLDPLKAKIRQWGFEPDINLITTPEKFNDSKALASYNLIVLDRNLESYPVGEEFISDIRGHAIYTEVIFYTAGNVSDLWNAIYEKKLEGVFVSSRIEILTKIERVGYQSIQKTLDLENMRGIVIAEVGNLDLLFSKIIRIGMNSLEREKQKKIFDGFYQSASEQNTDNNRKLTEFNNLENDKIDRMLDLCDSNKLWQNFRRLIKCHEILRQESEIKDYDTEILKRRNALAHGIPKQGEDGSYIFYHKKEEYRFDYQVGLDLRLKILEYKGRLTNIINLLNGGDY